MNEIIKNYEAAGPVSAYRFAKYGANAGEVDEAAAATDPIIGVTDSLGATAQGDRIDVIHFGWAEIELGGSVTQGDLLTANASGQAVAAAPAAGVNNRVGAMALASGVSGDIIPVLVLPQQIQG